MSSTDKFLRTVYRETRDSKQFSAERFEELLDPAPRIRKVMERFASLIKSGELREEMTDEEVKAAAQRITDEIMPEHEHDFLAKLRATSNPGTGPENDANSVSATPSHGAPASPPQSSPSGSATER